MHEARYHAIGLFDDEERRAEHEETTKTFDPLDLSGGFRPEGA
jgi:hypothetical protein